MWHEISGWEGATRFLGSKRSFPIERVVLFPGFAVSLAGPLYRRRCTCAGNGANFLAHCS